MKPPPFTHHAPRSVAEAVELLAELGEEGKVLAGGQSLVPLLNMRLASPAHLVDINAVDGLGEIEVGEGGVRVGACVRHAALERHDAARRSQPLLRQALLHVAHPAIRNRGTTVGSITHADPNGEMPAILVLTEGDVIVASVEGERVVPAADFFVGPMESTLGYGDLVTAVRFGAASSDTRTGYDEFARRSGDYALAGVGVAVNVAGGRLGAARASFVSVTDVPSVLDLTSVLDGAELNDAGIDERLRAAAELARDHVDPVDDIHASADYRRHLVEVLTRRVLVSALTTSQPAKEAVR